MGFDDNQSYQQSSMEEMIGLGKRRRGYETHMYISNDVLEDIMLRLPVRSLIRFQMVSTHWMRTIKSTSFKEKHLLRQKTQGATKLLCIFGSGITFKTLSLDWSRPRCLIEEEQGPAHHIKPQSRNCFTFSRSCDGLFCFFDDDDVTTPIIVANPATRRSQVLPLSRFQQQCPLPAPGLFPPLGFGKDNVTGTYKLVWLRNNKKRSSSLLCEVFHFEVKEWRYVMDTPKDVHVLGVGEPIYAEGWLYWLTSDPTILAYNLHSDMFRVITDRNVSGDLNLRTTMMCILNDRLWFTDTRGINGVQHFWRVKDPLASVWESEKMFSLHSSLLDPWFPDAYVMSLPCIELLATSKDDKQVLLTKKLSPSSKLVQLLPHPTCPLFHSVFSDPSRGALFTPYFQSLHFPL